MEPTWTYRYPKVFDWESAYLAIKDVSIEQMFDIITMDQDNLTFTQVDFKA